MNRHYSTKEFFRQIPNALLARHFHSNDLFSDFDFAAMKETQPEELFTAWLELPDGQRNTMDAEFREIFTLSCERAFARFWTKRSGTCSWTQEVRRICGEAGGACQPLRAGDGHVSGPC